MRAKEKLTKKEGFALAPISAKSSDFLRIEPMGGNNKYLRTSEELVLGFTLIELMVSMIVFGIVILAFLGLFSSAIKQQGRILRLTDMSNNAFFSLEIMDRALRMAQKDMEGSCVGVVKNNYSNPNGLGSIRFLNYDGRCQEFFLEGQKIKTKKSPNGLSSGLPSVGEEVTSSNNFVEKLSFSIIGDGQSDQKQPKVTIGLTIRTDEQTPQELYLQTTISQRELDVPL